MRRSTRSSRDLGVREGYWEGLILKVSNLTSGEFVSVLDNVFLAQSTNYDPQSREIAFFMAKCNSVIQHKRFSEDIDDDGNLIQEWETLNSDVNSYSEAVTYKLRQEDPGLLENTKYTFQVPKSMGVSLLDRFIFNGKNFKVDSLDDVGMDGVIRAQVSDDVRTD